MTDRPRRRFPPPWSVEETAPRFIVRDANKQALAEGNGLIAQSPCQQRIR
jgi:hypothetical protein